MNSFLIILICLIFSAFFSGMEIAYISSNRLRIELDRKQGHFASGIVMRFINNPGIFLTTMLVGNNIALVAYGLVMANLLEPIIAGITQSPILILILQTFFSTLLILVTAEFLPKVIFRSIANTTLNIFSIPVMLFYLLFYPLTTFISWASEKIIRSFHKGKDGNTGESEEVFNKVDLVHLINQAQERIDTEDNPADNDLKLFQNALDFPSVKVRDCMVPRTEITAIEINSPLEELQQKFIETGFSKILVFKDNIDNIIGYVTSKSLFKKMNNIQQNVISVEFIPETMSGHRLLEKFIQDKKGIAVVVDEFGGVSGMVTIEDIIEEIFGEIEDEHDTIELIEKQISDEEFIFSGRLEIDYLNEKYHINIPESEDYETLAGFIVQYHENIPKLNERILIEEFELKILKVSKTKIDLVHLKTGNN